MGALQWLALGIPVVVFAVAYLLPGCILRAASRLFPRVIFFFRLPQPASKLIALTIDDSPDEVLTPAALAVLQQHGARASFFCIGAHVKEAESGAAILKQMVQQGCELGNHTWLDRPSWKLPAAVLESELRDVEALFSEAYREAGVARPAQKWFRPGQGFFTGAMLDLAEAQGYLTALGDCFPYDPQVSWWQLNAWMVLHNARPGSIIILHDCHRPWLIPTLQAVLPELRRRGYSVVTLSELWQASRTASS